MQGRERDEQQRQPIEARAIRERNERAPRPNSPYVFGVSGLIND